MDYFLAINNKQLGICLRMLYAKGFQGRVETVMNGRHKIEFHISVGVPNDIFEEFAREYQTLIS